MQLVFLVLISCCVYARARLFYTSVSCIPSYTVDDAGVFHANLSGLYLYYGSRPGMFARAIITMENTTNLISKHAYEFSRTAITEENDRVIIDTIRTKNSATVARMEYSTTMRISMPRLWDDAHSIEMCARRVTAWFSPYNKERDACLLDPTIISRPIECSSETVSECEIQGRYRTYSGIQYAVTVYVVPEQATTFVSSDIYVRGDLFVENVLYLASVEPGVQTDIDNYMNIDLFLENSSLPAKTIVYGAQNPLYPVAVVRNQKSGEIRVGAAWPETQEHTIEFIIIFAVCMILFSAGMIIRDILLLDFAALILFFAADICVLYSHVFNYTYDIVLFRVTDMYPWDYVLPLVMFVTINTILGAILFLHGILIGRLNHSIGLCIILMPILSYICLSLAQEHVFLLFNAIFGGICVYVAVHQSVEYTLFQGTESAAHHAMDIALGLLAALMLCIEVYFVSFIPLFANIPIIREISYMFSATVVAIISACAFSMRSIFKYKLD